MPVKAVTRDDVEALMHDVAAGITATVEKTGGPGGGNTHRGAVRGDLPTPCARSSGSIIPVHGVMRFADPAA
jgi:hypothetical protein